MKQATAILAALSQNIKINNREELLAEAKQHIMENLLYLKGVKPTEDNLTLEYLRGVLHYPIKVNEDITMQNISDLYGIALKYSSLCKTYIGGVHHDTYCVNVYMDVNSKDVIVLRVQDNNEQDIFLEASTNLSKGNLFNIMESILEKDDLDYFVNTTLYRMATLIK